jgi:hypothetical protein
MTDFTPAQVEAAFAANFPSDDILYDNIDDGWEKYENKDADHAAHLAEYLSDEYNELADLLDWSELAYQLNNKTVTIEIDGKQAAVTCVQQLGGMDEGTTADVTFNVGTQYFTKRGWYASHYGYEYDGAFEETIPKERPVEYDYVRKN